LALVGRPRRRGEGLAAAAARRWSKDRTACQRPAICLVALRTSQSAVTPACRRYPRQRSVLNHNQSLSSATAHPEQVEAPKGDEDQGARGQSQQHDNCFQHRLTPLVWRKHARRSRNCHHSVPANVRAKPFSAAGEKLRKQTAVDLVVNKTGTADMQLIFELVWNQSRSRFLATIHTREHRQ
jgi:hypothetical protein